MADAEGDLRWRPRSEIKNEQRQHCHLRDRIDHQDERKDVATRNRRAATASPTTSPITIAMAKATASSQKVVNKAR